MAPVMLAGPQLAGLPALQPLVGAAAIGAGQAAGAELDAAVPADYQHRHTVAILALDGGEDRPAGGATRFAVVAEAVLLADLPGPAVVRGAGVAGGGDERLRLGHAGDRHGAGEKAALADLLAVLARAEQGEGHGFRRPAESGRSP